ncbi:hypothetical protein J4220_01640 [Candidatus Micrarchaeota archaeon]|nr:hypothetical protein [Candidatus Micrarchaeota archaeon]
MAVRLEAIYEIHEQTKKFKGVKTQDVRGPIGNIKAYAEGPMFTALKIPKEAMEADELRELLEGSGFEVKDAGDAREHKILQGEAPKQDFVKLALGLNFLSTLEQHEALGFGQSIRGLIALREKKR